MTNSSWIPALGLGRREDETRELFSFCTPKAIQRGNGHNEPPATFSFGVIFGCPSKCMKEPTSNGPTLDFQKLNSL